MADHNDFGKLAEDWAIEYLSGKGYTILYRNYRFQKAEIDIIARQEEQIVIVEVKARAYDTIINPEEAVSKKKIKLLVMAANQYVEDNHLDGEVRFDIISIVTKDSQPIIQHIINAFESIDAQ